MQIKLFFILFITISVSLAGILPDRLGKYGILAHTTITNSGSSIIGTPDAKADIGLYPGSAVTGFPPGIHNGVMEVTTPDAQLAKGDLAISYGEIASVPCTTTLANTELGGKTFAPGVYCSGAPITLTGTMYLSQGNKTGSVWIFQLASTLTTATVSQVVFLDNPAPCNLFWNVGSSVTLGDSSIFQGVINTYVSVSFGTGATITGKALAQTGAVTLLGNFMTNCVEQSVNSTVFCYGLNVTDPNVCNGNGTCATDDVCVCRDGYSGAQCTDFSFKCYGVSSNSSTVCNGKGTCESSNKCVCNAGYTGVQCDAFACFGINSTDSTVCNNRNGTCESADTCKCRDGYSGAKCTDFKCYGIQSNSTTVCNGKGTCTKPDQCACNSGSSGPQCADIYCYGIVSTSPHVCNNGNGTCASQDKCVCRDGYIGAKCEGISCHGTISTDPLVCSGNGTCAGANSCVCNSGFTGDKCNSCKPGFNFVQGKCSGAGSIGISALLIIAAVFQFMM